MDFVRGRVFLEGNRGIFNASRSKAASVTFRAEWRHPDIDFLGELFIAERKHEAPALIGLYAVALRLSRLNAFAIVAPTPGREASVSARAITKVARMTSLCMTSSSKTLLANRRPCALVPPNGVG
jgi:hypothetical protein